MIATKDLWRLSLGVGYRFSPQLILKTEYSFERGRELEVTSESMRDLFGSNSRYGLAHEGDTRDTPEA